jgi:hypothetical protein
LFGGDNAFFSIPCLIKPHTLLYERNLALERPSELTISHTTACAIPF